MLGDAPQPAGSGTKTDHRKVVSHDTNSAWYRRQEGGKKERQPLTASVCLTEHGVVALREREYQGGQRGGGGAVNWEGP